MDVQSYGRCQVERRGQSLEAFADQLADQDERGADYAVGEQPER